jgi:hypothetical protein
VGCTVWRLCGDLRDDLFLSAHAGRLRRASLLAVNEHEPAASKDVSAETRIEALDTTEEEVTCV